MMWIRVWGNPHQDKSHRRTGWQTTLLLNMGGSCPYLLEAVLQWGKEKYMIINYDRIIKDVVVENICYD